MMFYVLVFIGSFVGTIIGDMITGVSFGLHNIIITLIVGTVMNILYAWARR